MFCNNYIHLKYDSTPACVFCLHFDISYNLAKQYFAQQRGSIGSAV